MNISNKKNIRGFTLIETLVAIGILMMAVVGPISVAYKSLKSSMVAKDQFTASYLAQDAIEYLKAIAVKYQVLPVCGSSDDGTEECDVDTSVPLDNASVVLCSDPMRKSCKLDFIDGSHGGKYYYDYLNNDSDDIISQFTRKIRTKEISAKEMSLEVTVSFLSGKSLTPNYVTVYSNIFIP